MFFTLQKASFYEEKDEKESWGHEEEDFNNRHFVDVEDKVCVKVGRHNDEEQDKFTMDRASSWKTEEEENLEKMEKKLKTLEELFSSVPTVLIKPTEHVDLKAPFMKEIPFSTSVASRRSLKEDKGEINPDADEEGLVKVTTEHRNIQCISHIR